MYHVEREVNGRGKLISHILAFADSTLTNFTCVESFDFKQTFREDLTVCTKWHIYTHYKDI